MESIYNYCSSRHTRIINPLEKKSKLKKDITKRTGKDVTHWKPCTL